MGKCSDCGYKVPNSTNANGEIFCNLKCEFCDPYFNNCKTNFIHGLETNNAKMGTDSYEALSLEDDNLYKKNYNGLSRNLVLQGKK